MLIVRRGGATCAFPLRVFGQRMESLHLGAEEIHKNIALTRSVLDCRILRRLNLVTPQERARQNPLAHPRESQAVRIPDIEISGAHV